MELLASKIANELFDNIDSTSDIIKNQIPDFDEFICNSIKKSGVIYCQFRIVDKVTFNWTGVLHEAEIPMIFYTFILNYLRNQGFIVEERKYESENKFGYCRDIIAFL